ncbi:M28 family peptidase [Algibacter mikhailovii]|uniref:M28 family peptidase n=1 Tax=Algibacter mikhailovii TaxID=425498 RepID=UPI002494AF3A|nr:M28 family peptidase [Algibacter mikhailovii]
MFKVFLFLLLAIPIGAFTQDKACDTVLFSETNLLKHIKSLSSDTFEGRRTGSQGGQKAQKYIINQLYSLGVVPLVTDYKQPFRFIEKGKHYKGMNILGFVKGTDFPDDYIVISAHYDHEGIKQGEIFNGADDNASGISALFSFAEYFRSHPPKHSIIIAAFDAEELGLQGSKYFLKSTILNSKDVVLNINMDMISRSDDNELYVVGASDNKMLKATIQGGMYSSKIKLLIGHDGYDGLENWIYSSDHAGFYKKGIPFLYFGVEDHEDYHEPTDTFENIHPEFYIEAVKIIISVFNRIDKRKI